MTFIVEHRNDAHTLGNLHILLHVDTQKIFTYLRGHHEDHLRATEE